MLLGNVLHWEVGYLGRQYPVLPAGPGFARKVKPLVKLGEREMAAYCVLRGIDYQVEECPMAEGNRHLGLKETLNQLESRSPGTKAAFLNGFWSRGHDAFVETGRRRARRARRRASSAARPTPAERCAFCTLRARAAGGRRSTRRSSCGRADDRSSVTRSAAERAVPRRRAGPADRPQAAPAPDPPRRGRRVPHPRRRARPRPHHRPGRGRHGPHQPQRGDDRAAAHARRVRAQDAARRAGDLPEGPRPDPDAGRHLPGRTRARVRRRLGRDDDDAAARGRADRVGDRLRAARRLRRPRPAQRRGLPRHRPPAHDRDPRRVRRHRGRRPRPHRARPPGAVAGGEARRDRAAARRDPAVVPADDPAGARRCARRSPSRCSAWPRPSRSSSAAGTSTARRSGPTTGWSRTPASSPSPGSSSPTE